MTKKLAIPEGNLLRVAAKQGITTLSALKEKTGVDRKTLRAINNGQPVMETTLHKKIADKLRIPLDHFLGPSTLDEVKNSSTLAPYHRVSSSGYHYREIELQQLDAAALRRLAGETDRITWLLKIDQMTDSLEATLLKLRESLLGWHEHLNAFPDSDAKDNLVDQISFVRTSADIDKSVEQLTAQDLKIYGGTYLFWKKEQARHRVEDYPLPILRYTSRTEAELCIAPEEKNNSTTTRVTTGYEPPQKFIESELAGIDFVELNYRQVWSRSGEIRVRSDMDDDIPF
jgi:hypothetical protein